MEIKEDISKTMNCHTTKHDMAGRLLEKIYIVLERIHTISFSIIVTPFGG